MIKKINSSDKIAIAAVFIAFISIVVPIFLHYDSKGSESIKLTPEGLAEYTNEIQGKTLYTKKIEVLQAENQLLRKNMIEAKKNDEDKDSFIKAERALRNNDYTKYHSILNESLVKQSNTASNIYYLKAQEYFTRSKFDDAKVNINKAIGLNDTNDNYIYLKSKILFYLHDYKVSLALQNNLLTDTSLEKRELYFFIGNNYYFLGKYNKAIDSYNKAIDTNIVLETDIQEDDIYVNMGSSYSELGKNKKAIALYNKAIKINLRNAPAYYNKGVLLDTLGEYEKEILAYREAIKIDSEYYKAYFNLGIVFNKLKEYKKAIKIRPEDDKAYFNKGFIYGNAKDYKNEIKAYKKAININPRNDKVYINMGIAYIFLKDYQNGRNAFKKAVNIDSKNHQMYVMLESKIILLEENEQEPPKLEKVISENTLKQTKVNNLEKELLKNINKKMDEVVDELYIQALIESPENHNVYIPIFTMELFTTNKRFYQYEKEYISLFKDNKEAFMVYEMLKILHDISNNKSVDLDEYFKRYKYVTLKYHLFNMLEEDIGRQEEKIKIKLLDAVLRFKMINKCICDTSV